MKLSYLLLSFLALTATVGAVSTQMSSFLQSYNVSQQTINNVTALNITYNSEIYTELFLNANPYLLVNRSGVSYSFVTSVSAISRIIGTTATNASVEKINTTGLEGSLIQYLNTSAPTLNDCLLESGVTTNPNSCTVGNDCQSCQQSSPICRIDLTTDGVTGLFGQGIVNFQLSYADLERNVTTFTVYANQHGKAFIANESAVTSALANISALTEDPYYNSSVAGKLNMYLNPTFSLCPGFTSYFIGVNGVLPPYCSVDSSYLNGQDCSPPYSQYSNISTFPGPWYCAPLEVGSTLCQTLTYNNSILNSIKSTVSAINANVVTSATIDSYAASINSSEMSIIVPVFTGTRRSQLNKLLNTTLSTYSSTVNETKALLSHIQNSSLHLSLSVLTDEYSNLTSNYVNLNVTSYGAMVYSALENTTILYAKQKLLYTKILALARNNTGLLIALQSQPSNSKVISLAYQQNQLNAVISSSIPNTTELYNNLTSINAQARQQQSINLGLSGLARGIDGPFASSLAKAFSLPYYSAVRAMPALAAILSLIIGMIVLLLFYLLYYSLKKSQRIKFSKNTVRAWSVLFIVIVILVVIYVCITYVLASSANSNAPISLFESSTQSAKSIGIVLNGTVTSGMSACASILRNATVADGKTAKQVAIKGSTCTGANATNTASSCLDSFANSGTPFIVLTNSSQSSIRAYSMYGTALYASGGSQFMSSCYPSYFIK